MDYREMAANTKTHSFVMATLSEETRNEALLAIAESLEEHKADIFAANEKDLAEGEALPGPLLSRLAFDSHKLETVINGIRDLIKLPDPLFHVDLHLLRSEELV